MGKYFKSYKIWKRVADVDSVNVLINSVNKHSYIKEISSDKDVESIETLNLPNTSRYMDFIIINVPSIYS